MQIERPLLNDSSTYPDNTVLEHHLGKSYRLWNDFLDFLKKWYPEFSLNWKYYKDGKSWLCKVSRKSKTICWISVWNQYFKISFYFTEKADDLINNSSLGDNLKRQFKETGNIGRLKPVILNITKKTDLKAVEELIGIKKQMK